jgi:hypothetical protein
MRIFTAALVIFSIFAASVAAAPAPELDKRQCAKSGSQCKLMAEPSGCCEGLICFPSVLWFMDIGVSINIILLFVAVTHQGSSFALQSFVTNRNRNTYENRQLLSRLPDLIVHNSQLNSDIDVFCWEAKMLDC